MATDRFSEEEPSFALVDWADNQAREFVSLKMPWDRPWFCAAKPPANLKASSWEYKCRCQQSPVRVHRFNCEGGKGFIWLGQCNRCEAVLWVYSGVKKQDVEDFE